MSKFQIRTENISKDTNGSRNIIENKFHTREYYRKSTSIKDQLINCRCWHPFYSHRLGEGKCDADFCICTEFRYGSIEVWDFVEEREENLSRSYEGGLF